MDANLKRSIILEHYQNPKNKCLLNDQNYLKENMNNESCIDEINIEVKIENNVIEDIRFDGEACAICTSSTSIMIDTLIGKTLDEVKVIYENFENMLNENNYNGELLEQAQVFEDISKQPNRKKCALLPWWGIKRILEKIWKNLIYKR